MKKFLIVAALLALLVVAADATAAKKGVTLVVNPTTPVHGQSATLSGCGYRADDEVGLYVAGAGDLILAYPEADSNGCFSYTYTPTGTGATQATVYGYSGHNENLGFKIRLDYVVT